MSKIKEAFKNGKAFIPFITGGDPDLETTKKLIIEMQNAGADIIEVGIPFSDPIAEGQVIQKADLRALEACLLYTSQENIRLWQLQIVVLSVIQQLM